MAKLGRPSPLDQPGVREEVAKLMSRGLSAPEIAELQGVHKETVLRWQRGDASLQEMASKMRRERVNKFVNQIDAELEKRLEKIGELSVSELLKIRQTVQPKAAEAEKARTPQEIARKWREQDEATAGGETMQSDDGQVIPLPGMPETVDDFNPSSG